MTVIPSTNISGSRYILQLQPQPPQLSSYVSLRSRCWPSVSDQTFRPSSRSTSIGGFEEGSRTRRLGILNWPLRTCRRNLFYFSLLPPSATSQVWAQCSLCLRKKVTVSALKGSLFSLVYLHQVSSSS